MNAINNVDAIVPTETESQVARESGRILSSHMTGGELKVQLDDGQVLTLPGAAARLLSCALTEMAAGNAVTLMPIHAEITTQEAADHLNVSRPFLIRLLEAGDIPFRKVGTHRRVLFRDVTAYRDRIDRERDGQDLGMGY